jgi:hypothetical protein
MSVSNDSTAQTINDGIVLLSSSFFDFCARVRNHDPSILPQFGKPFRFRPFSEKEDVELVDTLLESNTNVTHLELWLCYNTKSSSEATAKYVRTSKRLRRIRFRRKMEPESQRLGRLHEEIMMCYFLPAIQESTSLKELHMELPLVRGRSTLAFESMLTHTQSLRSLSLICPDGPVENIVVGAALSGLKKNTTLRELTLTLDVPVDVTTFSPILTSLRDHPFLQRLCLCGYAVNLTGLETMLLRNTSKITELELNWVKKGRKKGRVPIKWSRRGEAASDGIV